MPKKQYSPEEKQLGSLSDSITSETPLSSFCMNSAAFLALRWLNMLSLDNYFYFDQGELIMKGEDTDGEEIIAEDIEEVSFRLDQDGENYLLHFEIKTADDNSGSYFLERAILLPNVREVEESDDNDKFNLLEYDSR